MKLSSEQITAAVEWWVKALENPKFDTFGPTRQRERERGGAGAEFAEVMATLNAAHARPARLPKLEAFGNALRAKLEACDPAPYGLFTDYGPDAFLHDVAVSVGLDSGITSFPWKTKMWFQNGGVQVACGYGAESVELLKKEPAAL